MDPKFLQPKDIDSRLSECGSRETAPGDTTGTYADNELARNARQGDLAAFEELFNRRHKRVYNIALHMLRDESEAGRCDSGSVRESLRIHR